MLTLRPPEQRFGSKKRVSAVGRVANVVCSVLLMASLALPGRMLAAESFKPFTMKSLDGAQKSLSDLLGKGM